MTRNNCIFCNGDDRLSKEHFWPDWLQAYVGKNPGYKYVQGTESGNVTELESPDVVDKWERSGHVTTKKFRVVCAACNNGWMSELEKKAKTLLEPLFLGKHLALNQEEQKLMSVWCFMKIMVADGEPEEGRVFLPSEMHTFYRDRTIPSNFKVYLGRHSTGSKTAYLKSSFKIRIKDIEMQPIEGINRNSLSVTFTFGPMVFCILGCKVGNYPIWQHVKLSNMKPIYPICKTVINTKALKLIAESNLRDIVFGLEMFIEEKAQKGLTE